MLSFQSYKKWLGHFQFSFAIYKHFIYKLRMVGAFLFWLALKLSFFLIKPQVMALNDILKMIMLTNISIRWNIK